MYVCLCHAVTEKHLADAIDKGARCMKELRAQLRITATCGKCASCAQQCLRSKLSLQENSDDTLISLQLAEAS
jgi:bacterioferritin-associated ferredoxin